jgi:sugar lactone lactonase YvrE
MTGPQSIVADTHCHTGEGALYHPDSGTVYWVDIPRGNLFEYDPISDDYEQVLDYDGSIGGFTIQADGDLLLFCDRGRVVPWSPDDGLGDPVVESVEGEEDSRFNDVIADPAGRVFAGMMHRTEPEAHPGSLYRVDTDASLTVVDSGVAIPNGMGFTPDRESLYFTETTTDAVYRYDYDESTGAVSNREVFVDASDVTGHPDGMTVDAEGDVWSAFWDGGRLARYASDGTERERVEFPAKKVSAVTFGGPEYETAYVTTALGPGEGEPGTREEEGTGAGTLFATDLEVSGVPEFRSRIDV